MLANLLKLAVTFGVFPLLILTATARSNEQRLMLWAAVLVLCASVLFSIVFARALRTRRSKRGTQSGGP